MEDGETGPDEVPSTGLEGMDEAQLARIVSAAQAAAREAELEERREILAGVEKLRKEKSGWLHNLVILVVSLAAFFYFGRFAWGWSVLLLVIPVVLIHELGHYAGMRAFGYTDVRMFFIPLFGGAVSGRSADVPGYKRAVVALLGPLPGLLAGLACVLVHYHTEQKLWLRLAEAFLLINGFNLLPFYPLDGGHLLNEVLFCRSRHVELLVRIASGALLAVFGFASDFWLLGILGVVVALLSGGTFREAGAADRLRGALAPGELEGSALSPEAGGEVIAEVRRTWPRTEDPKVIALKADGIWERLQARPPSWPATLALLAVYGLSLLAALAVWIVLAMAVAGPAPQ